MVSRAALEAVGDVETVVRARLLANLAVETVYSGQEQRRRALSDQSSPSRVRSATGPPWRTS